SAPRGTDRQLRARPSACIDHALPEGWERADSPPLAPPARQARDRLPADRFSQTDPGATYPPRDPGLQASRTSDSASTVTPNLVSGVSRTVRRVQFARQRRPLRRQPGHDVGDFLIRHRTPGHVAAPVRRPEIRTTGNDEGSQALVADQTQIRGI